MTCRTAREALDVILGHEPGAERDLIRWNNVVHVEHGLSRTDESLRMAVTVEAPFHLKRRGLPDERHPIDGPVTRRASDALMNMDAVIEIDEVRQIVNAVP